MKNDIIYTKNEQIDINTPALYMTEITSIVCDMINENLLFSKKNGLTSGAKKSRERLLKLLDITEAFNKISCDNATLKSYNKHLLSENQKLKAELNELERQNNLSNAI